MRGIISKLKKIPFLRFFWHKLKKILNLKKKTRSPAIIQIVPWYGKNDAIGNNVSDISNMLTLKKETNYILFNSSNVDGKNGFYYLNFKINQDDMLVYHMAMGSDFSRFYKEAKCKKKILVYHNITPAKFFKDMPDAESICKLGRKQLVEIAPYTDLAICVSNFNAKELKDIGYKNIVVLPISHHTDRLLKYSINKSNKVSVNKIQFLFVGRIARNKCINDVIETFNEFLNFSQNACLNIVGRIDNPNYYNELKQLIIKHNIEDKIFFHSNIEEKELASFYSKADIYLCESEHEGFCVPLIEAMAFKVPIFAYDSTAISETLGKTGFLFKHKNHKLVAKQIYDFLQNTSLIKEVKEEEYERYLCFNSEDSLERFYSAVLSLKRSDVSIATKLYDFSSNKFMEKKHTELPFSKERFVNQFSNASFKPDRLYNFKIKIKRVLIRISPKLYDKVRKFYKRNTDEK